jgi:hypothetical protein
MPDSSSSHDTEAVTAETKDELAQQQTALIRSLLVTVQHFFGGFDRIFQKVHDPRHPVFITYPLPVMLATGVLMFLLRLGARRQIALLLRQNGRSSTKFEAVFDVETCPHGDSVDKAYQRLIVEQVQESVTGTTETLIRNKVLYRYRLFDRYFLVSIDGTGMLTFSERHCDHCLTMTHHGRTTYYHPILEAKLVTRDGLVFSLMTEFVENPAQYLDKQDCELKAFYRLAERLKKRFPRLPICLLKDGLFANGPVFSICEKYRWKYIIVLQEKSLPSVQEQFNALLDFFPENHLRFFPADQYQTEQHFHWINDIEYVDSKDVEHFVSVVRCMETKPDSKTKELKTTRFKWITNFKIKTSNVIELSNEGGRLRWKIENEGFNVQKNGGYALEHIYTHDPVSAKVFYLLLQIAHTIAQLIAYGSLFHNAFPKGVGSAKNIALRLLEAWRNVRLSTRQIQQMLNTRLQIRLKPP